MNTAAEHVALSPANWPAADSDAWDAAVRPADFLEEGGKGADWRPASRCSAQRAYGRWLGWLISTGVILASEAPAARFTSDRLREYVAFLRQGRSSVTVASYLGVLCMVVVAMFPDEDWRWLQDIQKRLHRQAKPSRNKAERLVPADELLDLGRGLIDRAGQELDRLADTTGTPQQANAAARDFRDGLIVALLALYPLRLKNLLQMEIGVQLRLSPGRTKLRFTADETKNHRPLHELWPETLEPALARYLDQVRPMLLAAGVIGRPTAHPRPAGARVWVAQGGTPLSAGGVQKLLKRHTRPRFGHVINTHLFRDCAATTLANEDPNHVRYAARVLGHAGLQTTERSYIAADTQRALDRYGDLIAEMRSAARPGRRSG